MGSVCLAARRSCTEPSARRSWTAATGGSVGAAKAVAARAEKKQAEKNIVDGKL
jgi:hypothetical protein